MPASKKKGCVAKTRRERNGKRLPVLLGLGRHSKEAGDEGDLPADVAFGHAMHLSLAKHVHDLVPMPRSPGRFHGKEAQPGLDKSFDKAMVLLDQVMQVFDQALVRPARQAFRRL